jgi:hypothetical protein
MCLLMNTHRGEDVYQVWSYLILPISGSISILNINARVSGSGEKSV